MACYALLQTQLLRSSLMNWQMLLFLLSPWFSGQNSNVTGSAKLGGAVLCSRPYFSPLNLGIYLLSSFFSPLRSYLNLLNHSVTEISKSKSGGLRVSLPFIPYPLQQSASRWYQPCFLPSVVRRMTPIISKGPGPKAHAALSAWEVGNTGRLLAGCSGIPVGHAGLLFHCLRVWRLCVAFDTICISGIVGPG